MSYTHDGVLYSLKKEILTFATKMNIVVVK
jgi:hypothetical protein